MVSFIQGLLSDPQTAMSQLTAGGFVLLVTNMSKILRFLIKETTATVKALGPLKKAFIALKKIE